MTTQRMARFHSLEVESVRQETSDAIVVGFRVPAELRGDFQFSHGQYITLKLTVNGEELRRSYSICSSPLDEGGFRIAVKKVPGGRASTQLVEKLKPGMRIELMTPMGSFTTPLEASRARHFVSFAAGSGITPILSILKTVLRSEPNSRFTLFYGNTDTDRIIFRARLQELKSQYGERLAVHHILSKGKDEDALFNGRITNDKARQLLARFVSDGLDKEFFICGPEQMMVNVSEALEASGVDKKHVHIELFTTPVSTEAKKEADHSPGSSTDFSGMSNVKVIIDGRDHELQIAAKGDAVLDVALDAGLEIAATVQIILLRASIVLGTNEEVTILATDFIQAGRVLSC